MHLYGEYVNENFSPGFLTTMRSISVNNECYALSAIKAKLNEHILCDPVVAKNIEKTMKVAENLSLDSTFGWQLETYFSPVSCLIFQCMTSSNLIIIHIILLPHSCEVFIVYGYMQNVTSLY